jgi:hypothetical protein
MTRDKFSREIALTADGAEIRQLVFGDGAERVSEKKISRLRVIHPSVNKACQCISSRAAPSEPHGLNEVVTPTPFWGLLVSTVSRSDNWTDNSVAKRQQPAPL